jgi:hypothetical protein
MKQIKVRKLPECDVCHAPARYDMPMVQGPWANLCRRDALTYTYLLDCERLKTTPLGSEYVLEQA